MIHTSPARAFLPILLAMATTLLTTRAMKVTSPYINDLDFLEDCLRHPPKESSNPTSIPEQTREAGCHDIIQRFRQLSSIPSGPAEFPSRSDGRPYGIFNDENNLQQNDEDIQMRLRMANLAKEIAEGRLADTTPFPYRDLFEVVASRLRQSKNEGQDRGLSEEVGQEGLAEDQIPVFDQPQPSMLPDTLINQDSNSEFDLGNQIANKNLKGNGKAGEFDERSLESLKDSASSAVSKRAFASSWLAALRQGMKTKRRRTLSINNALVTLTDMLVQRGIDRLNKNRASMRRHMLLQG